MVPRAYWSPAALEVREAQDALLCLEAAHSSGVGTCLEAINEEQGRNACLPQIQVSPNHVLCVGRAICQCRTVVARRAIVHCG